MSNSHQQEAERQAHLETRRAVEFALLKVTDSFPCGFLAEGLKGASPSVDPTIVAVTHNDFMIFDSRLDSEWGPTTPLGVIPRDQVDGVSLEDLSTDQVNDFRVVMALVEGQAATRVVFRFGQDGAAKIAQENFHRHLPEG
jgi:hypothetical protein